MAFETGVEAIPAELAVALPADFAVQITSEPMIAAPDGGTRTEVANKPADERALDFVRVVAP